MTEEGDAAETPSGGRYPEKRAPVVDPARLRSAAGAQAAPPPEKAALFMYGTLRDPALFEAITGADPAAAPLRLRPATAPDHRVAAFLDPGQCARYPVLAPAPGRSAQGVLVEGLSAQAMLRLLAYEGADYVLTPLIAQCEGAAVEAFVFTPADQAAARAAGAPDWSFERWLAEDGPLTLWVGRELGRLFDGAGTGDFDHLYALADSWPELIGEGAAALGLDGPVASRLGRPLGQDAVRLVERERPYDVYFKVDRFVLKHRRLGAPADAEKPEGENALCDAIERACFRSGPAVCVLPYDPVSDRVLLIEQFRVGPWAENDARPWLIEAIAGRIDKISEAAPRDAAAAQTARRESEEEAGLTLGRMERLYEGYSSPGICDEALIHFVAEASLPAPAEGDAERVTLHGLAGEGEDIRAFTLPIDDALAALAAGEIRNGPTALLLLLAHRRRPRLRALWR